MSNKQVNRSSVLIKGQWSCKYPKVVVLCYSFVVKDNDMKINEKLMMMVMIRFIILIKTIMISGIVIVVKE